MTILGSIMKLLLIALSAFMYISFIYRFYLRWRTRRKYGKILLRFKEADTIERVILSLVSSFLPIAIIFSTNHDGLHGLFEDYAYILFWCSIIFIPFYDAFIRIEIREHGIIGKWSVLKWEELYGYHWDEAESQKSAKLIINGQLRALVKSSNIQQVSEIIEKNKDHRLKEDCNNE